MNAPTRRIRLEPDRRKLLEAILYLMGRGERQGDWLTQYQVVKSLFMADTAHLERYGRPITFDNYVAMDAGPVATEAYDMLKPGYSWRVKFDADGAPWEREPVEGSRAFRFRPTREPNLRVLSRSDVEALDAALRRVRELGFGGVKDETHTHPAYIAAWEGRGAARAVPMDYALLLPDAEAIEDLVFASAHRAK
jgi:uncharacterized phage-associated protein